MYRLFVILFFGSAPKSSPGYRKKGVVASILLLLFVSPQLSLAEEHFEYRYVADEFRITMRNGPAASFKVIQMLKTGMKLTLLEKGGSGWDKIRASNGREGWVLRRFITAEVPARIRFNELEKKLEQIQQERDHLQEQLQTANIGLVGRQEMERELEAIRGISGRAVSLDRENRELTANLEIIEKKLVQVSLENKQLSKQADTRFFLAGAAVLILGVIIGAILFRRRRPSYDTL